MFLNKILQEPRQEFCSQRENAMHFRSQKSVRRLIIILDTAATTAAFLIALYLRMWSKLVPWRVELYSTVYVLNILIYLFWNTYRRAKHHEYRIAKLDPVENIARVFRERVFQYVALIVLLSATHSFEKVSRLVLLYAGMLDFLFTSLNRLLLRDWLHKTEREAVKRVHYLIVTEKTQEKTAAARLAAALPETADVLGVFAVERCEEGALCGRLSDVEGKERRCGSLSDALEEMAGPLRAYVYLPDSDRQAGSRIVRFLRERNIPVSMALFTEGRCLPDKMIHSVGPYAAAVYEPLEKRCDVFGVNFTVSDVETAAFSVLDKVLCGRVTGEPGESGSLSGQYLCFSNVHTTVMAHDDPGYRDILNGSAFTFPDGKPIAEYQKNRGFSEAERVAGPDFMDAVFRATMDGRVAHYFYGSTPETIEKLRENLERRYPGIRIAGMVSPPFRPETPEEDAETVRRINESGAALIWIGLGAPKQERWMAAHRGKLSGVMLGVGAGFNFYAGTVKRAPVWVQKIVMEWLYRLLQDPKRLANRYLVTNVKYLWYLAGELFHSGKR